MIGDSTMNGIFNSLACLLRRRSKGTLVPWESSKMTKIHGDYGSRNGEVYKQVFNSFLITCNGQVFWVGEMVLYKVRWIQSCSKGFHPQCEHVWAALVESSILKPGMQECYTSKAARCSFPSIQYCIFIIVRGLKDTEKRDAALAETSRTLKLWRALNR